MIHTALSRTAPRIAPDFAVEGATTRTTPRSTLIWTDFFRRLLRCTSYSMVVPPTRTLSRSSLVRFPTGVASDNRLMIQAARLRTAFRIASGFVSEGALTQTTPRSTVKRTVFLSLLLRITSYLMVVSSTRTLSVSRPVRLLSGGAKSASLLMIQGDCPRTNSRTSRVLVFQGTATRTTWPSTVI